MNKEFKRDKIKLASFDIDGTIFEDGVLTDAVAAALRRLHESGMIMVLATGRMVHDLPGCVLELGIFGYAVCGNGAFVWDLDGPKPIAQRMFDRELSANVLKCVSEETDAYYIAFETHSRLTHRHLELLRREVQLEKPEDGSEPVEIYTCLDDLPAYAASVSERVVKFGCRFDSKEACRHAAKRLREECGINPVSTGGTDLELTPPGIDKGSGMLLLCEHLGLDISNVIAFGDSGNDAGLLETAGFAVAMADGQPEAIAAADYVCPSVYEDGVAKAVGELFG